jgi:hypothetical protein
LNDALRADNIGGGAALVTGSRIGW